MPRSIAGLAIIVLALQAPILRAQGTLRARGTITADAGLYAEPGRRPLATLRRGTDVAIEETRGGFTRVTVQGWVAATQTGAARDSYPITARGDGRLLRAEASERARVVASLRGGMGLTEIDREGRWIRVQRTGWVRARSVAAATPVASTAQSASGSELPAADGVEAGRNAPFSDTDAGSTDSTAATDGTQLTPALETELAAAPGGDRIGVLAPGARAEVTGREKGWVRVRVDGWARERDFSVADSGLRDALSAADLRADPEATRGRLVHWDVLVLAHQVADPLRRGLVNQEPYLLAQGPGRENALLYLAIPPALAATAREIPDLSQVTITARVRHGRSEPVGVPVLDLLTIVRR